MQGFGDQGEAGRGHHAFARGKIFEKSIGARRLEGEVAPLILIALSIDYKALSGKLPEPVDKRLEAAGEVDQDVISLLGA